LIFRVHRGTYEGGWDGFARVVEWSGYRFLESAINLKAAVKAALDREPNTSLATDAATCLRQGRQFFESAANASIEIRPLLVQYGVIAMGKAVAACRMLRPPHTFAKSHGLSDTSEKGARLAELKLRVDDRGSFQEFSDAVRSLDSITYFGSNTEYLRTFVESSKVEALVGKTITFDELFSRMPNQVDLYVRTFTRDANVLNCYLTISRQHAGGELTVYVKAHTTIDRTALKTIVHGLRQRFTFLSHWILSSALCAYGDLRLVFASVDEPAAGDTDEPALQWHESGGEFRRAAPMPKLRAWQDNPPPTSGSLAHPDAAGSPIVRPLQDIQLTTYAIMYMAAFMLGSLVRYRPETWVHALAGRVTRERALDDQALALIEEYLAFVLDHFPTVAISAITTRREDVAGSIAESRKQS
jgi:hypothetical protein